MICESTDTADFDWENHVLYIHVTNTSHKVFAIQSCSQARVKDKKEEFTLT